MSVTTDKRPRDEGGFFDIVKVVLQALLIALVIRTLLFQPFNIPSGSMMNTLLIGDYVFVSKYAYGYSRYSIPFGPPVFSGRIWAAEPQPGDIAVFKYPRDNSTDYIKRVIGVPGNTVQMIRGVLHIDNVPVKREALPDLVSRDDRGVTVRVKRWRETLPNGVSYETLDLEDSVGDDTVPYKVPPGHFFMMGDNRDNSSDSRVMSGVGFVPFENFVGRAEIIFFSIEDDGPAWMIWKWPWTVRWSRIFTLLR